MIMTVRIGDDESTTMVNAIVMIYLSIYRANATNDILMHDGGVMMR